MSDLILGLKYLGTLDDTVDRYPFTINGYVHTESALQTLLRSALFGGPIIVHEGYLVHNSKLRKLMLSKFRHIVYSLARCQRLIVLSSTNDISKAQEMKSQYGVNTSSNKEFLDQWDGMRIHYDKLSEILNSQKSILGGSDGNGFLRVPNDGIFDAAKLRLAIYKRALEVDDPISLGIRVSPFDYDYFRCAFERHLVQKGKTPRSAWEDAGMEVFMPEDHKSPSKNRALQDLMTYASEAYHMSMALALSRKYGINVPLETNFSNRFTDIFRFKSKYIENREQYNIRIPLDALISRFGDFCVQAFLDTSSDLYKRRDLYEKNKFSKPCALAYEEGICNFLKAKNTPSALDEEINDYAALTVTTIEAALAIHVAREANKYISNEGNPLNGIDRRKFMSIGVGGAASLALTTSIAKSNAPDILSEIVKNSGVVTVHNVSVPGLHEHEKGHYLESKYKTPSFFERLVRQVPLTLITDMEVEANNDVIASLIGENKATSL